MSRGVAAIVLSGCVTLSGQTVTFDVVSIKLNQSGLQVSSAQMQPNGGVRATNVTAKSLITMACDLGPFQVDGPSWLDAERFDLAARTRPPGRV